MSNQQEISWDSVRNFHEKSTVLLESRGWKVISKSAGLVSAEKPDYENIYACFDGQKVTFRGGAKIHPTPTVSEGYAGDAVYGWEGPNSVD